MQAVLPSARPRTLAVIRDWRIVWWPQLRACGGRVCVGAGLRVDDLSQIVGRSQPSVRPFPSVHEPPNSFGECVARAALEERLRWAASELPHAAGAEEASALARCIADCSNAVAALRDASVVVPPGE